MKLITAIWTAIALLLGIFLLFGFVLFSVFRTISISEKQNIRINNAVYIVNELKELTLEYIIYPSDRVKSQWIILDSRLGEFIRSSGLSDQKDLAGIGMLSEHRLKMQKYFVQLTRISGDSGGKDVPSDGETKNRVVGSLLVQAQSIVTGALELQESAINRLARSQRTALIAMAVFGCVLLLTAASLMFLFIRRISAPLMDIQRGTAVIGSGNLSFRIPLSRNDEIGDVAKSFNAMTEKLEHIDILKSNFITVAAHQLRTPLGIIRWNSEYLQTLPDPAASAKVKKIAGTIERNVKRMVAIISELLEVVKLEEGGVPDKPELLSIRTHIRNMEAELSAQISEKQLSIIYDIPKDAEFVAAVDPYRFDTVIRHLLSNAVQYTPQQKEIRISVRGVKQYIEIQIRDSGIGIPKSEQGHIFSKFFRAENAIRLLPDGSGLGLYIAHTYVRQWGGALRFTSQEDKGTTFIVQIPYSHGPKSKGNVHHV